MRKSNGLWRKHPIRSEFYRDAQHTYVELWPAQDLAEPDLLLYWTGRATPESGLLPESRLLGTFAPGKAFALPPENGASSLVLYSLAHQVVVDTAALEKNP